MENAVLCMFRLKCSTRTVGRKTGPQNGKMGASWLQKSGPNRPLVWASLLVCLSNLPCVALPQAQITGPILESMFRGAFQKSHKNRFSADLSNVPESHNHLHMSSHSIHQQVKKLLFPANGSCLPSDHALISLQKWLSLLVVRLLHQCQLQVLLVSSNLQGRAATGNQRSRSPGLSKDETLAGCDRKCPATLTNS